MHGLRHPYHLLLCLLMAAGFATAEVARADAVPGTAGAPEDAFIADVLSIPAPLRVSAQPISLSETMQSALKTSPAIAQAREKITEAELQRKDVRKPLFFYLIAPLDTLALKRTAEQNTDAAKAHLEAVTQSTLLETARLYTAFAKAWRARLLAWQAMRQAASQLRADEKTFGAGKLASFDVIRSRMRLLQAYRGYLSADAAWRTTTQAMAIQTGRTSAQQNASPEDAFLQPSQEVANPALIAAGLTLEEARHTALNTRPDYRELVARETSLRKLEKTVSRAERPQLASVIRQMDFELQKSARLIQLSLAQAYSEWDAASQALASTRLERSLGERFARQIAQSRKAGFSSDNDASAADFIMLQATLADADTVSDFTLAQIRLLYEMGTLRADAFQPANLP